MKLIKKIFHTELAGEPVTRVEPCRLCKSADGVKVGEVDFWDLKNSSLVRCHSCGLIQLDPMLSEQDTETGCNAFYIESSKNNSVREEIRNKVRNFRRGILFASRLQKYGFNPNRILEFGPGSGYFSAGIKFIFPRSEITVVDIVDDVLEANRKNHNYKTYKASPENIGELMPEGFDLVIARDIIEHVTDIGKTLANVYKLLDSNGLFHFITPNGHADVWSHYVTWKLTGKPSELLINHVNYFDGQGLLLFLRDLNFRPVEYYTYKLKTTLRGKGWSLKAGQAAKFSKKKTAGETISENNGRLNEIVQKDDKVLKEWYITGRYKWFTVLYCRLMHGQVFKLSPGYNIGHEIYGLFRKTL